VGRRRRETNPRNADDAHDYVDMRLLLLIASLSIVLSAAERPPNIVLIYADDLGYGDLSCYGATAVSTPNCDRVAAEGLRLTNGYCTSATCTPSRYSLLTGEYAWRKKGTGILPGDAAMIIEPGRATVPALLKRAGYATAVVGKWHLGLGAKGTPIDWNGDIGPGPLDIGFDHCFMMPATGDRVPTVYLRDRRIVGLDPADPLKVSYKGPFPGEPTGTTHRHLLTTQDWDFHHNEAVHNGVGRIGWQKGGTAARWKDEDMADDFARAATAFIEQAKDKPFFLFFATHSIHVPRVVHQRFAGKTGMGPRGDAILEFDFQVGAVLDALMSHGLTDNTLVIITSDNGAVLNDGYKDQAVERLGDHRPSGVLRGGKYSAFEGGCRVPFIVRGPGVKPGVSEALVSQVDFGATFAALAGVTPAADELPDSLPQADGLLGKDPVGRPWAIEHTGVLSLRVAQWKFIPPGKWRDDIVQRSTFAAPEPGVLFDLAKDPGERTPVDDAARLADMKAQLAKLREMPGTRPGYVAPAK
jgi:arylsulfatase A-like enzyme